MTNYNQLIKNWHTKASEDDYFSKFMFEYLAFIAYLRTQKYRGHSNDRVVLQLFKNDDELKKSYFKKISGTDARESYNKLEEEFKNNRRLGNVAGLADVEEIKWWNHQCLANHFCQNNGCGDLSKAHKSFTVEMKGRLYGENDWGNLIEFWRAVRDNLFHGSKNPDDDRDKFMVEHGFKTLQPLVEILINRSYD